jgi:hypothetical protein
MTAATAQAERRALITHLTEVIADLRQAGQLHDAAWGLDDLRAWLEHASGITFRSYVTGLGSALPPGWPS